MGMNRWLFKEEPDHYNFADLQREGTTLWDGVSNNLARLNLRKVRRGDRIWYYHSGREKAIVGEMRAVSGPVDDPNNLDPKAVAVQVEAVRRLQHPVSLARIKGDSDLADWELVRMSRLSVMPVSDAQWQRVEELSRNEG
jgi:predicted RNA-binding protein with PUA-like domain